jgi:low temperature requirement protein LtrA
VVSTPSVATPSRTIVRPDDAEARVSPLELFFDLVFVFALTQVTALVAAAIAMGRAPGYGGRGRGHRDLGVSV